MANSGGGVIVLGEEEDRKALLVAARDLALDCVSQAGVDELTQLHDLAPAPRPQPEIRNLPSTKRKGERLGLRLGRQRILPGLLLAAFLLLPLN